MKITKPAAEYTDKATGARTCSGCAMFHPADHTCDLVRGFINAGGWCKHWIEKEKK